MRRLREFTHYLLLAAAALSTADNCAANVEDCWSGNASDCLVHAILRQATDVQAPMLPMEIDCRPDAAPSNQGLRSEYSLRRYEHTLSVTLDGCQAPLQATSYGFEFLPHCQRITHVTLERFHADVLPPLSCDGNETHVQVLQLQRNEFASIARHSLAALGQHLRELHINGNALRQIERHACDVLSNITLMALENEPLLAIRDYESDLFARCNVSELRLRQLRGITALLLQQLPTSLTTLLIANTPIEQNGSVLLLNAQQLQRITLTRCKLSSFKLVDMPASVLYLNLSGNMLQEFAVETKGVANVETLDLSDNLLSHLPLVWLEMLPRLRILRLYRNLLVTLPLAPLLRAMPAAELLDVRANHLIALESVQQHNGDYDYERTRLQVGENPWNCMWLLDFAHFHPEKFRIFQYEKFISQLNVNGLACSAEPLDTTTPIVLENEQLQLPTAEQNVSARHHGSTWDLKRSQRAEALTIIFLLPLGIACLFVLLYMWIYCQKMFHLSFYRSCRWPRRHADNAHSAAERFDVVRHLPPPANDGYEIPLNGDLPLCNKHCDHAASLVPSQAHFNRRHNITYEALPNDLAYRLYEEILAERPNDDDEKNTVNTQAIYDHLAFDQPTTDL